MCAFAVLKLGDLIEREQGGMVVHLEPQGNAFIEVNLFNFIISFKKSIR